MGWDHIEKVEKHDSQKGTLDNSCFWVNFALNVSALDYKSGFGGQFGVQKQMDKSAVGWEHHEELQKHESQKDYSKGFGGKFGVQSDRKDKSALSYDDQPEKIGTNYQKTKPELPTKNAGNLRARFENMAKQSEEEAKKKAEDERKKREEKDKKDKEEAKRKEEKRLAEEDQLNQQKEQQRIEAEKSAKLAEEKQQQIQAEKSAKLAAVEEEKRQQAEKQKQELERQRLQDEQAAQKQRVELERQNHLKEQEELEKRRKAAEEEELQKQRDQEAEWARQEAVRIQQQDEEEAAKAAALAQAEQPDNRYDLPPEEAEAEGVVAVALYDYQAAADDEISFDPNDVITNIEMVSLQRFGDYFTIFPVKKSPIFMQSSKKKVSFFKVIFKHFVIVLIFFSFFINKLFF